MSEVLRKMRCAIYTRKSTEEGLDQNYNSLDAQRDACQAYIASQKSEGWVALLDAYDDGGFTGGNLHRPGLQRLLADIREGLVDVIVVYKIDRLSRSLADFAKLVELFDEHKVIEGVVLKIGEFHLQHGIVPAGILGDAVVRDDQGAALGRRQVVEHHDGDGTDAELLGGREASMPGDNDPVATGQDGVREAKLDDGGSDLSYL